MSSPVVKRLLKAGAAQGFGQAVSLIIQLVNVPLFLAFWGSVKYGEWIVLSAIPGYLTSSDLSFGTAAVNHMTMLVGGGDRDEAQRVYRSTWLLIGGVTVAIAAILIGFVLLTPIERWLQLQDLGRDQVVLVIVLMVLQVTVAQQGGIIGGPYRAEGHFAVGTVVTNVLRLAEFAVTAIALIAHGGMVQVATAVLIVRLIGYGGMLLQLRKLTPWYTLGFTGFNWGSIRPLVGPALTFNAFPIGQAMNLQGVVFVISSLFGPAAVVGFTTMRTLSRVVWQFMNVIANTVWVEISRAFGEQDLALARRLHSRACQVGLWGALAGGTLMAIFGPWVYLNWTKHKVEMDYPLFLMLLAAVVVSSLWSVSYIVPMAINRHQKLAGLYLLVMTASLAAAYALGRSFGIYGVGSAVILAEAVMAVLVVRLSNKMLEEETVPFLQTVFTPPVKYLYGKLRRRSVVAQDGGAA